VSVAGVNRRVHRRAYYGAAAAGPAGYGYYNYARRCAYWTQVFAVVGTDERTTPYLTQLQLAGKAFVVLTKPR
jgi:hypothetical protein